MVGVQYEPFAAGSSTPCAKLAASGVRFHEAARASASAQIGHGRQLRSETVRIAIGAAANRSRAMFSPTGEETAKAGMQATRYTANVHLRMRARGIPQVSPSPIRQNVEAATNSSTENGKLPRPGNIRLSRNSSAPMA